VSGSRKSGASRTTVIVALAANAVIAVTKVGGALVSGSTALLAEAAHSLADTTNQGFLLASIALASRAPSEGRPFGHGQQRFLWAFLAAVGMFVAGAVFAIGFGVLELVRGESRSGGFTVAWITLAVAAAAESLSWLRAVRQTRAEAAEARKPALRYVRESRDPSVKMVLFEDSAAIAGVGLAALGIALHQLSGQSMWDPLASIAIGLLLVSVAFGMARDTGRLLLGAAARDEERDAICTAIESHPGVVAVPEVLTMVLGPDALLVAARVDLDDRLSAARVETIATQVDAAIRRRVPDVSEVFLDATATSADGGAPGRRAPSEDGAP
jgi:cation diffusion facilitator family transporter